MLDRSHTPSRIIEVMHLPFQTAGRPAPMKQDNFKVYGYRWIVLVVFMFIVAVTQLLWITFAPITGDCGQIL